MNCNRRDCRETSHCLLAALLLLLALVGCAPESSYPEDSYLIRGTVYLKDQLATPIICIYRDEEYGGGLAAISVDNLDDFEIGDRVEARVGGRIMEMSPCLYQYYYSCRVIG